MSSAKLQAKLLKPDFVRTENPSEKNGFDASPDVQYSALISSKLTKLANGLQESTTPVALLADAGFQSFNQD